MITEVILPALGETMREGTIARWLVNEGDAIQKGDPIYQMESDKALLEVEATVSGVMRAVLFPTGSTVPVLTVVALIGDPTDDISRYLGKASVAAPTAASAAASTETKASDAVAASLTPAATGRAPASPRARRVAAERGIDLALVTPSDPGGRIVEADVLAYAEAAPRATPLARKVAAEAGVEISTVLGTGPGGRVTRVDVERAATPVAAPQAASAAARTVPMAGIRARIAERMLASAQGTARVTLTTEVDATRFVETRERLKQGLEAALGFNLGYNELLIAMCARALREHQSVNCRLSGDKIQLLDEVHIGLAVDTDRGLLVPVVRNADRLGLQDIARQVRGLAARARDGQSLPDELTGGTFTITNLGMFGIDAFTPIINLPECAILGVGRIAPQPAVVGGEIVVRQRMWLSLTFDHRLVDGAPAARFLQRVAQYVEEPVLLLG
jgi:pyruvate dehydrogenase E2 component (dihydrolipoamide acetyltransferase)